MGVYSWRRRRTEHFGDVWVPFAEIELQLADGGFQAFAVQIDSGAVISLLRRSVADLLGVPLERAEKIELGAVGGNRLVVFRHELVCRIDKDATLTVPFAIAEREDVPNLLGRLGVFDTLQVNFDASLHATSITEPWLNEREQIILDRLLKATRWVLPRYEARPLPGRADKAVQCLVARSGQLLDAVAGLVRQHLQGVTPPLLRSMFELSVQLEYLLQSPEVRAEDFLEFEHVSRYRLAEDINKGSQDGITRQVSQAPHRAAKVSRNKCEYERVRWRYEYTDEKCKTRVRKHWYKERSFRDLCNRLERETEYKWMYKPASAWLHIDPLDILGKRAPGASHAFLWAMRQRARVLLLVANAKEIQLPEDIRQILDWRSKALD